MYKLISEEPPPLDVLVRTHAGDENYTQKAILKVDGWYFPNGSEKLSYEPLYWQPL